MAEKEKQVETAPDPDEDDLDDLDDVLDEFQPKAAPKPTPAPTAAPPPTSSGPGRPPETAVEDPPSEAELSAQLQEGMKGLIGELGEDPEMQQKFEAMMAELIAAGAAPSDAEAAEHIRAASDSMPKDSSSKEGKKEAEGFQDTIRRTMERMQASGDAATAASTSGSGGAGKSEEELLAQMMKELGGSGGGEGNEEDFNKMLMGMMSQLTNKEILYEPMKELDDKFPGWMEKNKPENGGKVGKEEMERYQEQARLVREIVGRFEKSGYSDSNEGDREFIVERMQKMQAAGSPPPDLVGDMSAAQDALGDLDAGCPTQ